MHFSTTSEEAAMFPSTCWHYPVVSDKEFAALLRSIKEMYCVSLFEFKGISSAVEKRLSITLNILSKCQGRLKKVLKAIACAFQHIQLSKSASASVLSFLLLLFSLCQMMNEVSPGECRALSAVMLSCRVGAEPEGRGNCASCTWWRSITVSLKTGCDVVLSDNW